MKKTWKFKAHREFLALLGIILLPLSTLAQSTDLQTTSDEVCQEYIDFTIVRSEHETLIMHEIRMVYHPVCLKEDRDIIESYLQPSESCPDQNLEVYWIDPNTANTICRGTIGAVFGSGTGKLLTRLIGGEGLAHLLEISSISEISGHSSGEIICTKLLEGEFLTKDNLFDWILESDSLDDVDTGGIWEYVQDSVSSLSYMVVNIGARGIAVALFVKVKLGIQNPVLAFAISTPLRKIFDIAWAYTAEAISLNLSDYEIITYYLFGISPEDDDSSPSNPEALGASAS